MENGKKFEISVAAVRANVGATMSREEFGKLLDPPVSGSAVALWESGEVQPKLAYLDQIAKLGKVPIDFLCEWYLNHTIDRKDKKGKK